MKTYTNINQEELINFLRDEVYNLDEKCTELRIEFEEKEELCELFHEGEDVDYEEGDAMYAKDALCAAEAELQDLEYAYEFALGSVEAHNIFVTFRADGMSIEDACVAVRGVLA